jgi:sugar O-acyltransferase (sialic acid O-acetyltransferase NeuD family)
MTSVTQRKLYIIGAGDFGREIETHLDGVPSRDRDWTIAGFLDDNPSALGDAPSDYRIVGAIRDFPFEHDDLAMLAIAKPATKKVIVEHLRGRVELFTFVSKDAIVGKFTIIGKGSFVGPRVVLGPNVSIGEACALNSGAMVGHDVVIGSFTSIMANCNIAGCCRIGEAAFLASSVTIIPGRRLCDGAFIGAGSVVIQHVNEPRTVFGNPAKYL